jgi:hypothetical protein
LDAGGRQEKGVEFGGFHGTKVQKGCAKKMPPGGGIFEKEFAITCGNDGRSCA